MLARTLLYPTIMNIAMIILLFTYATFAQENIPSDDRHVTPKKVTIYLVIDDSISMKPYQAELKRTAEAFTKGLVSKGCIDYQIGVHYVSMAESKSGGPYAYIKGRLLFGGPAYITPTTPNGIEILRQRIMPPSSPYSAERVLDGLVATITAESKMLAQQDYVAALILSDAGPFYDSHSPTEALKAIHESLGAKKFSAYALGIDFSGPAGCVPDINFCQLAYQNEYDLVDRTEYEQLLSTDAHLGEFLNKCSARHGRTKSTPFSLAEFTALSGGRHMNICRNDYEKEIQAIVESILEKSQCSNQLLM